MISLLLLNNFYPVVSFKGERKRRIVVYGSVARYGPRNQSPAQWVKGQCTISKTNFISF